MTRLYPLTIPLIALTGVGFLCWPGLDTTVALSLAIGLHLGARIWGQG